MRKEKKLVIVDYGVGNFRNVQKAFQAVGAHVIISDQAKDIDDADAVILPGVGAFGDAIDNVRARDLEAPMLASAKAGKPFFGICVGMQLLFETSNEMGQHQGLSLLPGKVIRFADTLTVPHMGWNQIEPAKSHALLNDISPGDFAYFAHSYNCVPQNQTDILAKTDYEAHFVSAVASDNIYGIQFHPEKSQRIGLQILQNFADLIV
ncbi:MAG: imidazole glycerol phosphate synthase subunit HisH [Chloroflexota bacterium]